MLKVDISDNWRKTFPGSHIGLLLVSGIDNNRRKTALDERKLEITSGLRKKYASYTREALLELDVLEAYKTYYKKFKKTYHVLLQLESVLFKGKNLPRVSPLVDACFAAELETMILTAGHDADLLRPPVAIDVSHGAEPFIQLTGKEIHLKASDMIMRDTNSVVCSVIYGQDRRTAITPSTKNALYVSYVPSGIEADAVEGHIEKLAGNIRAFAPDAHMEVQQVISASE